MRHRRNAALAIGLLLGMVVPHSGIASTTGAGTPPPALAPYAEGDPISKIPLTPHPEQDTPRKAVESFLAYLSKGLNPMGAESKGTILGLTAGYEKAWALMGKNRPTLSEFKQQWARTVRLGVVQLEPLDEERFFVELHRLEFPQDHWATSFYYGEIRTIKTPEGWRIADFKVVPEDLVSINIGGHQAWQHDAKTGASVWARSRGFEVEQLEYVRRLAIATIKSTTTGEKQTLQLARLMEGSWVPLGIKQNTRR